MDFDHIQPKVRRFFLRTCKFGFSDIRRTFVHEEVLGEDHIKDVVLFVRSFKGKVSFKPYLILDWFLCIVLFCVRV